MLQCGGDHVVSSVCADISVGGPHMQNALREATHCGDRAGENGHMSRRISHSSCDWFATLSYLVPCMRGHQS